MTRQPRVLARYTGGGANAAAHAQDVAILVNAAELSQLICRLDALEVLGEACLGRENEEVLLIPH